jgi:lysophospholipase L1-like esterase
MYFLVLLFGTGVLLAQSNPAFAPVTDAPGLPRVLLIGDSISIGYTVPVQKLLAGKANVHRVPDNAGPTTHGVQFLETWLGQERWDVIHFNFGLHDLKLMWDGEYQVRVEDYERNLRRLAGRLKQTGAILIWASTTPAPAGNVEPPRTDADVVLYNQSAAKVMKAHNIPIDDLYSAVRPRLTELQLPNNVHFRPEGYAALAQQVAESILGAIRQTRGR